MSAVSRIVGTIREFSFKQYSLGYLVLKGMGVN